MTKREKIVITIFSILLVILVATPLIVFGWLISVGEELRLPEFKPTIYERGKTDYFTYYIYSALDGSDYICIDGFTEIGKEQDYLIFPKYINGLQVAKLKRATEKDFDLAKAKKVFVPTMILLSINGYAALGHNVKKVIRWESYRSILDDPITSNGNIYIKPEYARPENGYYAANVLFKNNDYSFHTASEINEYTEMVMNSNDLTEEEKITRIGNYKNEKIYVNDGYAWLDHLDKGEKLEVIPPNPTKEGYTFAGWYKDEQCTEIADLTNIIMGEKAIIFFAKWGENYEYTKE